ncbi:enoyl-CoA hydratase-related protein, partial [Pseudomonadales bacterium]|nr:enoyl-CoA hydratase-related protein [Pseudomonadales bacterium]
MDFEQILYEKNGPVLTITLNRPDKLNAYTALMQAEIIQALDAADADDDVRAIIFTGAGRGFCAGADLSGGGNTFNNDAPGRDGGLKRDGGGVLTLRIFESLKPIISACNGPAVGVGATMQCAMDVRLASENARYGFVFS